ncbi:MAG: hypothetical protein ACK5MD_07585 [Flavobacteriales bacterium]
MNTLNIKKSMLTLALLMQSILALGQAGINTDTPQATLDVVAKKDGSAEGVIAPRLTGDQIKAADAQYEADQKGVIVYATYPVTTASTKTVNITKEGYYYFDGSVWVGFSTSSGTTSFVPYTVAAGESSTAISQLDQSADKYEQKIWYFNMTINDGNWHNNTYTVPETGYYQITLQGVVQPSHSRCNSFSWDVKGDIGYTFDSLSRAGAIPHNKGGAILLHLEKGNKISFTGTPCQGCNVNSPSCTWSGSGNNLYPHYTVGKRAFSIVFFGS